MFFQDTNNKATQIKTILCITITNEILLLINSEMQHILPLSQASFHPYIGQHPQMGTLLDSECIGKVGN